MDLGQHLLSQWFVALRHQAIAWTNIGHTLVGMRYSHVSNSIAGAHADVLYNELDKLNFKIISSCLRGQWVDMW